MNSDQLEAIIRVSIVKVRRLKGSGNPTPPNDSSSFKCPFQSNSRELSPLCLSDNTEVRSFISCSTPQLNPAYTISNLSSNYYEPVKSQPARSKNNVSLLRHLLITRIARKAKEELTTRTYLERLTPSPQHFLATIRSIPFRTFHQHQDSHLRSKRLPSYSQDLIHHCLPEKMPCLYDERYGQTNNYDNRLSKDYLMISDVDGGNSSTSSSPSLCLIKGVS